MRVKITYKIESYIEGEDLQDIKIKFESGDNLDEDFQELVSVEDRDTGRELLKEYLDTDIDWEEQ